MCLKMTDAKLHQRKRLHKLKQATDKVLMFVDLLRTYMVYRKSLKLSNHSVRKRDNMINIIVELMICK